MPLGKALEDGLVWRWRLWPCLAVAILVMLKGVQAVEQTCHDRNVAHCDYLVRTLCSFSIPAKFPINIILLFCLILSFFLCSSLTPVYSCATD